VAATITNFVLKVPYNKNTCFQNKSMLIAEDYFEQHMNIATNKSLIK